jgi:hypothetical protein
VNLLFLRVSLLSIKLFWEKQVQLISIYKSLWVAFDYYLEGDHLPHLYSNLQFCLQFLVFVSFVESLDSDVVENGELKDRLKGKVYKLDRSGRRCDVKTYR